MLRLYPVESKLGTPQPSAASDRVERKRSNRANHNEMSLAEALKRFSWEIQCMFLENRAPISLTIMRNKLMSKGEATCQLLIAPGGVTA